MKKMILIFLATVCMIVSSCIPPFFENVIELQDYFSSVTYQTYVIDYAEEQGYKITEEKQIELYKLCDGNEDNISFTTYKQISFKSKRPKKITSVAFVMKATEDCLVKMSVKHGEVEIRQIEINLKQYTKKIVDILELEIELQEGENLIFSVENPLELVEVYIRFDSFLMIGE